MAGYDLHVHTNRSDGTFTPTEAVDLAVERGLTGIAITDHDTLAGLDEAASAAGDRIEIVPGIEFSAEYEGASLHVLAYWIDPANEALRTELTRLTDTRFRRGELMVEKLQELGYPIDFDRVREIAGGDTIARPHVAQAMVEAGIVPNEKAAFTEEFIADGGRAWVPKHALHPAGRAHADRSGGRRVRAGASGHVEGGGVGPRRADRGDGRGRHGRPRGRPSGPRRDPAGEVPGDGGAAGPGARRARPIATGCATTPCGWGARPPAPIASPSSAPAPWADRWRALEMVFFDIGGVMYDDTIYARAMHTALRALGASFTDGEFDDVYRDGARRAVRFVPRVAGAPVPRTRRRHGRVGGARHPSTGHTRPRRCTTTSVRAWPRSPGGTAWGSSRTNRAR